MPSSITQRMSSQRRPWAHIFPLRSDGTPMFPHWTTVKSNNDMFNSNEFSNRNFSTGSAGSNLNTNVNVNTTGNGGTNNNNNTAVENGSVSRISPDSMNTNLYQHNHRGSIMQQSSDKNFNNLE